MKGEVTRRKRYSTKAALLPVHEWNEGYHFFAAELTQSIDLLEKVFQEKLRVRPAPFFLSFSKRSVTRTVAEIKAQ